jgi:glycosyltransferase involved in cell wall biosynthesis
VQDRVHLLGYRPDPGAILRDATDVLVASAEEEAFGLNVIEAQWIGVPVIASDVAGHREALSPDAGVLVPPLDPEALAAALLRLAGDPARRRAMGEAGRAFASSRFRMEAYVGAFEALYDELLRQAPARRGPAERSWPPTVGRWLRAEMDRRVRKLRRRWPGG